MLLILTDLGQFLSSEVQGDRLCVAGVVDFDVDLVIVLVFPDERSLETGHLVLLPMDENLRAKRRVSRSRSQPTHLPVSFFPPTQLNPTTCGGLRARMNSLVC